MKKLFSLLMLAISFNSYSQQLITDTLFGNNGEIFSPLLIGNAGGDCTNLFKLDDNSILLCGYYYDISANAFYNSMMKTDACGSMDTTFGINGYVKHTFDQRNSGYDYAMQSDGKIVVCGAQSSSNAGSQQFPFVARYFSNGSPDTTFGVLGTNKITFLGPQDFTSVFIMPDGKILCTNGLLMMRFDTLGMVDNSFGTAGVVQLPTPSGGVQWCYRNTGLMRSDGKILSVATWYNGVDTYLGIMCYDTLGVVDSTFGTNGFVLNTDETYNASGWRLILQNDGKVLLAKQNSAETAINIMRYTVSGNLDASFGVNGYVTIATSSSIIRLQYMSKFADDKFLIGYSENGIPSHFKKYTANGVLDPNFSINGGNYFQFNNNTAEPGEVGIASANDEITMGGFGLGGGGRFALTRFVLHSSVPQITQNFTTLNANVQDTNSIFQWYLNGAVIPGATDTIYTFSQNGNYTVTVTNLWGCEMSDTYNVSNTGIENPNSLSDVAWYPNPVTDLLTLNNSTSNEVLVNIYEISGKLMCNKIISMGSTTISTSAWNKGVYLIEFIDMKGTYRSKIIRQ